MKNLGADKDNQPLVSINIPTYNSGRTLAKTLESIKKQTYPEVEILIIDSYSTDQTLDLARQYWARIFQADTLGAARQVGVSNSQGEYILLLDSDQILDSDVIERCVRACEEEGYDGVTMFEKSLLDHPTFVERVIAYDKWLFHAAHDDDPIYGTAIPRFFRASFLRRIDYEKNPPITFEHSLIHYGVVKMGARIKFIDAYILHHEPRSMGELARKFYRYGYYYIPALQVNRRLAVAHSLPRRTYFTRAALRHPVLFVGLFLLYLVKGAAAAAGTTRYVLGSLGRTLRNHKAASQ